MRVSIALVLACIGRACGLGLTVEPVLVGDTKKYSSLSNLAHCISYPTVKDDIILVRIQAGDRQGSQHLNLNIFDLESNKIRFKRDIGGEINLIFTNLNNPAAVNSELEPSKRSLFDRLAHIAEAGAAAAPADLDPASKHINSNQGKSLIYICFDNVYTDRLWLFAPQPRDVELYTDIKTMSNIMETNYNNYAHYFSKFKDASLKLDELLHRQQHKQLAGFTQQDFEQEVLRVERELAEVIETLTASKAILLQLMEQEFLLRDANEAIFAGYTKISIAILVAIFVAGTLQLAYQTYFLRKQKVI